MEERWKKKKEQKGTKGWRKKEGKISCVPAAKHSVADALFAGN